MGIVFGTHVEQARMCFCLYGGLYRIRETLPPKIIKSWIDNPEEYDIKKSVYPVVLLAVVLISPAAHRLTINMRLRHTVGADI